MVSLTISERKALVINPSTREIIIPKSERTFGVYKEFGIEKKTFMCPKLIGGNVDLTECYIFVHYISSSGSHGMALCTDVEPTEDGTCITFSWLLTENVFDENRDATIYFSIHAKRMDEDGDLTEVFRTRIAQGKSYETVDSSFEIKGKYADIIVQILAKIEKLEEYEGEEFQEKVEEAFANMLEETSLEKRIKTNETLKVTEEGELAVNVTSNVSEDNTLPVTAAAVQVQIGNINALLETI